MPMTSGSQPLIPHDRIRARTGAPSSFAFSSVISTTAAPASFMPDALPAVTVPSSS